MREKALIAIGLGVFADSIVGIVYGADFQWVYRNLAVQGEYAELDQGGGVQRIGVQRIGRL